MAIKGLQTSSLSKPQVLAEHPECQWGWSWLGDAKPGAALAWELGGRLSTTMLPRAW